MTYELETTCGQLGTDFSFSEAHQYYVA